MDAVDLPEFFQRIEGVDYIPGTMYYDPGSSNVWTVYTITPPTRNTLHSPSFSQRLPCRTERSTESQERPNDCAGIPNYGLLRCQGRTTCSPSITMRPLQHHPRRLCFSSIYQQIWLLDSAVFVPFLSDNIQGLGKFPFRSNGVYMILMRPYAKCLVSIRVGYPDTGGHWSSLNHIVCYCQRLNYRIGVCTCMRYSQVWNWHVYSANDKDLPLGTYVSANPNFLSFPGHIMASKNFFHTINSKLKRGNALFSAPLLHTDHHEEL